ncbi:MAG: D-alanyl-D-alanine carboxypeptidase family protein, partial [Methylocystaceae bacterium]
NQKCLLIFIALFILASFTPPASGQTKSGSYPEPKAKAAVLMDAASGRVLYAKNSHDHLPPASLTKIMTGLLVAENGKLDQKVSISKHAAQTPEATIYLQAGEVLTRRQLLYACMLHSANDAAAALAESVSGSQNKFVNLMNHRAHQLGMKDTHYRNPHGLNAYRHYTSAYDLSLVSRQALANPTLRKVVATKSTTIPWSGHSNDRLIINHNRLLNRYPGAIGVKTGYTKEAGNCVVGAAQRGNLVLIAVAMNSPQVYQDLMQILDYGFAHYQLIKIKEAGQVAATVKVLHGETSTVTAQLSSDLAVALKPGEKPQVTYKLFPEKKVSAPVKTGQILGNCKTYINGEEIGQSNLVAAEAVAKASSHPRKSSIIPWITGLIFTILLFLLFLKVKSK